MELGGLDPKTSQEMKLFARARAELEPEILDFGRARAEPEPQNLDFGRARAEPEPQNLDFGRAEPSQSRKIAANFEPWIRGYLLDWQIVRNSSPYITNLQDRLSF